VIDGESGEKKDRLRNIKRWNWFITK